MSADSRIVARPTELQGAPLGLPGIVIDSEDPDNSNPPRVINDGQELQVRAQRADLDTPLASSETAQLQVLLRVRVAISANMTPLTGLSTVQSVPLADGDMVLLFGQTNQTQNGPWVVHANRAGVAQAWTRPAIPFGHGAAVFVLAGTYAGQLLQNTNLAKIVYGTAPVTFSLVQLTPSPSASPGVATSFLWSPRVAHITNVASLSGPATLDGVSCVAGDMVFLIGQTDAKENGPWIIRAGAWERPLTSVAPGQLVFPLLGNVWAGITMQIQGDAALTYGTSNIILAQIDIRSLAGGAARRQGTATLVAGVVLISNVTLTAGSSIEVTRNTPAGTAIGHLSAPAADRTLGVLTGSFRVRSYKADATAETADISTVDWTITN